MQDTSTIYALANIAKPDLKQHALCLDNTFFKLTTFRRGRPLSGKRAPFHVTKPIGHTRLDIACLGGNVHKTRKNPCVRGLATSLFVEICDG
jgi:hypothetical protein